MTSSYDRILDATLELVREKSYHVASTTVIAKKASISKSTIFHHCKTKEGILLKLFEETALNVWSGTISILIMMGRVLLIYLEPKTLSSSSSNTLEIFPEGS